MTRGTELRFRIRPSRVEVDRQRWPPRRELYLEIDFVFFTHRVGFTVSGVEMFGSQRDGLYVYPLLAVAIFMRRALDQSRELGVAEFEPMPTYDRTIFRALPDGYVEVTGPEGAVGVAKREEIEQVMDRFDASVREFLLAEFPDLRDHSAYGWWFRGEPPPEGFFEDG